MANLQKKSSSSRRARSWAHRRRRAISGSGRYHAWVDGRRRAIHRCRRDIRRQLLFRILGNLIGLILSRIRGRPCFFRPSYLRRSRTASRNGQSCRECSGQYRRRNARLSGAERTRRFRRINVTFANGAADEGAIHEFTPNSKGHRQEVNVCGEMFFQWASVLRLLRRMARR